ncbi:MAG: hypothetical protein J1F68_00275 [Clostridiales bacterium]|nr:hypothetical protein [Clostridiales bacterium]
MPTQELFDYAQERYRHARRLVTDMIEFIHKDHPNFDSKNPYFQFDAIVQFILLKVALADGKFLEIEGEFIDQITDGYDILQLFDNHDDGYDWSFAGAFMTFEQVQQLVDRVEKLATDHIIAFSDLFAEIDLRDRSKNYVQQIYECIRDVASAFIMADGTASEREIEAAVNVVRDCLTEPWLAKQNKLKSIH